MVLLLAGHPALDIVGTVAERTTTRLELLPTPADLDAWLVAAGLLDTASATADDLAAARRLREAIHAVLRSVTEGGPLPRDVITVVERAAAGPPVTRRLAEDGQVSRLGPVAAALAEIARSAVDLVGGPDRELLRWCADETCTHPFLDRSRGGRRRWCGMTGCGDRAKARAYRARRRTSAGHS